MARAWPVATSLRCATKNGVKSANAVIADMSATATFGMIMWEAWSASEKREYEICAVGGADGEPRRGRVRMSQDRIKLTACRAPTNDSFVGGGEHLVT